MIIPYALILKATQGRPVPLNDQYELFQAKHGGWHTVGPDGGLTGWSTGSEEQHEAPDDHFSAVLADGEGGYLMVADSTLDAALAERRDISSDELLWY